MALLTKEELPSREGLNVLLVEDNRADAKMFSTLLKEKSPSVNLTVVHDGAEAVDTLFRRGSQVAPYPDLVLLDLNLPCKNGFEVLAETRSEETLKNLPVFLLTTSASREDIERAKALGVSAFLTKACDLQSLEEMISGLVDDEFPKIARKKHGEGIPGEKNCDVHHSSNQGVSVEAFRLLVESVRDYAIFMLSPEGCVLTWHEGAKRIKQYEPSEIIGKHFSVFYTRQDIEASHPERELRIAEQEGRYEEEGWRLRKDGTLFWARVSITAVRGSKGELIGFGKVTRDLSDRKMAEERLRDSEERFRILVEGVQDYAIFMLDPLGNIISWNRGAERINGYRASEVLGRHFSIFYAEKAKAENHPQRELELALKDGTYKEDGIRVRKDGSTFWANVLLTALFDGEGRHTGFAKVTRDITDKRKMDEEMLGLNVELEKRVAERTKELEESQGRLETQKEELTRSNQALQQFAYVASHDLQEPLRVVVSHLQLVNKTDQGKLSADSRESIGFAIESAVRMRALVQDLLAYARIEKAVENLRQTDFSAVVGQVKAELTESIAESKAKLVIGPLPTLEADTLQIGQLFQNLMSNAICYRSPERDPEVTISAKESPTEWTFSVQDNGIGIDSTYWHKIFVIFQRLHSDNSKYPGTGIGLAICKKIVERHHGRIWLESTVGVGTTFFFTIPKVMQNGQD